MRTGAALCPYRCRRPSPSFTFSLRPKTQNPSSSNVLLLPKFSGIIHILLMGAAGWPSWRNLSTLLSGTPKTAAVQKEPKVGRGIFNPSFKTRARSFFVTFKGCHKPTFYQKSNLLLSFGAPAITVIMIFKYRFDWRLKLLKIRSFAWSWLGVDAVDFDKTHPFQSSTSITRGQTSFRVCWS